MATARRSPLRWLERRVIRRPRFVPVGREGQASGSARLFAERGYAVVPGVLTEAEVQGLREICNAFSRRSSETEMPASEILAVAELAAIPFRPRVVDALRTVLGAGYTVYPNFKTATIYTSWHVDNNFRAEIYPNGAAALYAPGFRHAQCILYLQDNHPELGGGLDVVPRSHRARLRNRGSGMHGLTGLHLRNLLRQPVSLGTRAGDLIFFDGRLLHRGTQPRRPPDRRKYGLFWSASRTDSDQIHRFLSYYTTRRELLSRAPRTALEDGMLRKYEDILNIRFPESFPPSVAALIRAQELNLATLASLSAEAHVQPAG